MPLVMSKAELMRIQRWTERDREEPEVVRRRELVKHLDATSRAMTKSWPNSLENVNKRNEELRRARIEAAEQANAKFYNKYLKRQREQQERLMYSARDVVFKNKDAPKLLLSAVIETVIQKERIEQLKFREERRREAAEQKRKDDADIIRRAKEWHELMALKRKRRFEANKQHQKEILNQAHEITERNRMEYETELNMQKIDNIKADQQMDALKEFETNFNAAEKARIWADMDQARREADARKQEQAARDKMDEKLMEVLLQSRARIDRQRIQTVQNVKNEKLRVLEKISAKLESGDAARTAREQEALSKAIQEKEAIVEARRQAQLRKMQEFKEARVAAREKFLRDEQQRLHEFNTMRQWEIMNRFKNAKLYEDFQEKLRLEKERKIKEFRADTLRLWKEREDREARERAETRYFYGELAERKLRDSDNRLLTHAAELLQEAAEHGRPDHALHEAIDRYCKLYRLYPMPGLPASMQEHFRPYAPWDGSRPDPGYRAPTPPPPDRGPDAPDEEEETTGRNGLQDPGQLATTTKTTEKKEKKQTADDYKRVGKANGLQRRHALVDVTLPPLTAIPCQTLPPLTAVPCQTEACSCPLKK